MKPHAAERGMLELAQSTDARGFGQQFLGGAGGIDEALGRSGIIRGDVNAAINDILGGGRAADNARAHRSPLRPAPAWRTLALTLFQ